MANPFFDRQHAAVQRAYATGLGGSTGAFTSGETVVVERPATHWGYLVSAVAFAKGALVAVAPELMEIATSTRPQEFREAVSAEYLDGLRADAVKLGLRKAPRIYASDILWALGARPEGGALPPGFRFEEVGRAWLNAELRRGSFENGAGTSGPSGREQRNRWGLALRDDRDEVVALAGVFDTYGLSEIGVDVVDARQGQGLGRAVVGAAVRAILDRGETPFYGCSRSNIRSQRTAIASGFLPVMAEGGVV